MALTARAIACSLGGSAMTLGLVASSAWAGTFPGTNGDIAWLQNAGQGQILALYSATGSRTGQLPAAITSTPSFSRDGSKIAWLVEDDPLNPRSYGVKVANADGSNALTVIATGIANSPPSLSPDGTKVAVASEQTGPGTSAIHLLDVAPGQAMSSANAIVPAASGKSATHPQISPDGTKIAYIGQQSNSGCNGTLYDTVWIATIASPGSGTELTATCDMNAPGGRFFPAWGLSWSPDGTRIAFGADWYPPFVGIVKTDGTSSAPTTLLSATANFDRVAPSFAPDGTKVAIAESYNSGSDYRLKIVPWDGSAPGTPSTITSSTGGDGVAWAPPLTIPGGGTPATTPSTAPAAGSTPNGPASLLRTITRKNTRQAARQGATQVAAPVNLKDEGRYTFIFEGRASANERWTEMQATGKRVVQLKNSRIGKKKLTRNSTAPVYTTTAANKRLVVVALIRKAQAKNLRLRVIHKATDGTLTQDVFNA